MAYPYYPPYQPMTYNYRPQQIQQSGFIPVQSEAEARAYPVAPGNSITFKDESRPYCYVKTMGFNQLDRPVFERYKLVKEEEAVESPVSVSAAGASAESPYALKSDMEALRREFDAFKANIGREADNV